MPAEWEPHDAVWLSWPHNNNTFPHLSAVEEAYYEFIRAVHTSERVELFVPTAVIHRKVRARLRRQVQTCPRSPCIPVSIPMSGSATTARRSCRNRTLQKTAIVHWDFNAWGGKYEDQIRDGRIPSLMNRRLNFPSSLPGLC